MKLTDEQLSHLMAALGCLEGRPTQENRGRIRVPTGTRATIIPCNDAARGEIAKIVVVNLSESGVGILNALQMRAGEQFILRLPATSHYRAGGVLCSVMYSQNMPNGMNAIGAQFVRVLGLAQDRAAEQAGMADPAETHDIAHVREVEDRLSRLSL